MSVLVAAFLWACHGILLWWNWGKFRPRIAVLHGLGVAVVAGGLIALGAPLWAIYAAGGLIGAVGGWGHPLAPGLWPGIGLLAALPFLLGSPQALTGAGAFGATAQLVAALVSFTKSSL